MDTETKPLWTTTREAMGKTWTIELWPDDAGLADGKDKSECMGKSWYRKQWIRIAAERPLDGRDGTVLHEIFHLAALCGAVNIKEPEVVVLADNLFAFLRGFGLWRDFPWPDREKEE